MVDFVIAPFSQELEPPQNPGRFNLLLSVPLLSSVGNVFSGLPQIMKKETPSPEYSLTVSRAFEVLSIFSGDRNELSLAEIVRETGLPKASVLRFVQAMLMHGYVEQDVVSKRFRPGMELFRVGSIYGNRGLQVLALPMLRTLAEETGFSTYFSILRDDKMVVVASIEGPSVLRFTIPVGTVIQAHSTSAGQAALATFSDEEVANRLSQTAFEQTTKAAPGSLAQLITRLRTVRAQGFAVSWEMSTPGVGSVAAATTDEHSGLAGVFTLGFGTGQITKSDCTGLGLKVRAVAETLSASIRRAGR